VAGAKALRSEIEAGMRRLISQVILYNHAVAQQMGLGSSDSQFMTLLDVHGPLTPGQLAKLSGLTTGTVTGVIDRLEQAGFVRRTRDTTDRRVVLIEPETEAIAERLFPHYREPAERLDAVLRKRSPEELRVIADFLADLTGATR
jgi:DNA-binding MarR family transcriptional regulator